MSIEWVLYLIDILNSVGNVLGFFLCINVAVFIVIALAYHINEDNRQWKKDEYINNKNKYIKLTKYFTASFIVVTLFTILSPSAKTMYAIAFAHYSKQSGIPEKVLKAMEVKLDEIIKGNINE